MTEAIGIGISMGLDLTFIMSPLPFPLPLAWAPNGWGERVTTPAVMIWTQSDTGMQDTNSWTPT